MVATGRELHKAAVHGDAEAYHHQLDQIAQLPGRDQRLALPMQQALAHGHATLSAEGAAVATLGTATGGLGAFGVNYAATAGVLPVAKEALGTVAASGLISGSGFVAGQAGSYGLNNEVQDQLGQEPMSGVLPRIEVSNSKGDFTFSMQNAASVRALITYLGPKEDKSKTSPQAPKESQEIEAARLTLKKMLGSHASENLVRDEHSVLNTFNKILNLGDEHMAPDVISLVKTLREISISDSSDHLLPHAIKTLHKILNSGGAQPLDPEVRSLFEALRKVFDSGSEVTSQAISLLKLCVGYTQSKTELVANEAFKKLLSEDWDWLMPAVRAIDQGKAQDINKILTYKLPLDAANGRVYLDKSPNLDDEQLSALEKLGSPSQLRLMYLAEGWI